MAKLFISATTKGLKSCRTAAAEKLRQLGHTVIVEDEFPMVHERIATMLADQIAPCDAVILLIGPVFGAMPADWPSDLPWRSYSQLEYDIALELQKPVFRFIASEDCECDPYDRTADPHQPVQAEYIRSMSDYLFWTFSSQTQLLTALGKSYLSGFSRHNLPLVSLGSLFKGRSETLQQLHKTLVRRAANNAVITANQTIAGLGGVGKTRLALEYAWQYSSEYAARLYVKADSSVGLRENLAALASTLHVAVTIKLEEQLQTVLEWLHTNARWLLILDNVDTEDAKNAVLDLLPQLTNGHVLITSRLATWTGTTDQINLDVLSEAAAVDFLLLRTDGRRRIVDTDTADATHLSRQLGHLPLALEQAGAFIAKNGITFGDYSKRWRVQEHKVLSWDKDLLGRYGHSVLATWAVTFGQLNSDGRALLHLLCWLAPAPIPIALIKKQTAVPGEEPLDSEAGIANLEDYSFLKRSEDKQSVSMHRLVQEIAHYQLPASENAGWLRRTLQMLDGFCIGESNDVRNWATIYTPARPHLARILSAADNAGIAEPTSRLMNDLGLHLKACADFAAAESLIRRAIVITENTFGSSHSEVATSINNLAGLLHATGRCTEAEALCRRAVEISANCHGPNHPAVATSLSNLAEILRATSRYAEAEAICRRVLEITEKTYGPSDPKVASFLNNLAGLLEETNRSSEAEPLYRRALDIAEANHGPHHPTVATSLNNLAGLLYGTGHLSDAAPLYRRALSIFETCYGPNHPTVGTSINNLATILRDTNCTAEAELLYRRAIQLAENNFASSHPAVAIRLNNLAELLRVTDRRSEAEPLYRRVVDIFEGSYGPNHPYVAIGLHNLAKLLRDTDRHLDAEPLYHRVLEIFESSYGPNHHRVATCLNSFAELLRETNRFAEAEPLYLRSLRILADFNIQTGHEHPEFAMVKGSYHRLLLDTGLGETEAGSRIRSLIHPVETD